jgi:hypothetical protein
VFGEQECDHILQGVKELSNRCFYFKEPAIGTSIKKDQGVAVKDCVQGTNEKPTFSVVAKKGNLLAKWPHKLRCS